jgi:hypothetical protein
MGVCCSRSTNPGEELVRSVLSDPHFTLNSLTYEQLKALLENKGANGTITKNQYVELYSSFYNHSTENPNQKIYKKILDFISEKFSSDRISIFEVLYFLFPFIDHKGQKDLDKFYFILNNIHKNNLTITKFEESLRRYVELCTLDITKAVFQVIDNGPEREELNKGLDEYFINENVRNETKRLVANILKTENTPISPEEFYMYFKEVDIAKYDDVRDAFLNSYEQK